MKLVGVDVPSPRDGSPIPLHPLETTIRVREDDAGALSGDGEEFGGGDALTIFVGGDVGGSIRRAAGAGAAAISVAWDVGRGGVIF